MQKLSEGVAALTSWRAGKGKTWKVGEQGEALTNWKMERGRMSRCRK